MYFALDTSLATFSSNHRTDDVRSKFGGRFPGKVPHDLRTKTRTGYSLCAKYLSIVEKKFLSTSLCIFVGK